MLESLRDTLKFFYSFVGFKASICKAKHDKDNILMLQQLLIEHLNEIFVIYQLSAISELTSRTRIASIIER